MSADKRKTIQYRRRVCDVHPKNKKVPIRHLSLSTGSPQSSLDTGRERESSSHHRTNSDTAPSSISKQGAASGLARSHSIAAAGDKSLSVGIKTIDIDKSPDRIMQELQYAKK